MWSNKGKSIHDRSANIKSYLGGFHGLNEDAEEIDNENDNDSLSKETDTTSCSVPNTQSPVSALFEIPEELDIARFPSRYEDAGRCASLTTGENQQRKEQEHGRETANTNDSAAVAEIGNNLMDLDNYMLSVFHMNDDASVYTKATTDTSFSSSISSSSTASTRRRHRGAFRDRRDIRRNDDSLQQHNNTNRNEKGHNWLESMKKSSMNIFVDGEDGWTPSKGWCMANKKTTWDLKPNEHWNARNPIFDSIKKERLEI